MRTRNNVLFEILIISILGALVSLAQTLWLRQNLEDKIEHALNRALARLNSIGRFP
ncbi:hypothetical protein [Bacillus sp. JJ1764]|uniref:hypothetical protein n=1 Tax=Bacillus sp. JJ1764 TaxID=3122964 RepID=UPI002FFF6037